MTMSTPITSPAPLTFIATYRVTEGAADELARLCEVYTNTVLEHEPSSSGLGIYVNEDRSRLTHVQMHRGADEMDSHLRLVFPIIQRLDALAEVDTIQVYGTPGPVLTQALDRNRDAGAEIEVVADAVGGFSRAG